MGPKRRRTPLERPLCSLQPRAPFDRRRAKRHQPERGRHREANRAEFPRTPRCGTLPLKGRGCTSATRLAHHEPSAGRDQPSESGSAHTMPCAPRPLDTPSESGPGRASTRRAGYLSKRARHVEGTHPYLMTGRAHGAHAPGKGDT